MPELFIVHGSLPMDAPSLMSSYTGPSLLVIFYFRLTDATRAALTDLVSAEPAVKLLHEFSSNAFEDAETFSRFKVLRTNEVIRWRHYRSSRRALTKSLIPYIPGTTCGFIAKKKTMNLRIGDTLSLLPKSRPR